MTTSPKSENDLAKLLQPVKPVLEKHGSKLILGLAAVLLIAAAWIWWSRTSAANAAAGWGDMATANAAEDFADIADDNPGTPAAAWARLAEADGYLVRAVQSSFTDREAALTTFKKAREAYDKLLTKSGTPRDVRERALFGVARLEESTAGEDVSAAVAAYEKVLSEFPESIYKSVVEKRLERLQDPQSKQFYAWFKEQNPSVADDLVAPKDLPETPKAGPEVIPDPSAPETPAEQPEGADKSAGTPPPTPEDAKTPTAPESSDVKAPQLPPPAGAGKSADSTTEDKTGTSEKASGDGDK